MIDVKKYLAPRYAWTKTKLGWCRGTPDLVEWAMERFGWLRFKTEKR